MQEKKPRAFISKNKFHAIIEIYGRNYILIFFKTV